MSCGGPEAAPATVSGSAAAASLNGSRTPPRRWGHSPRLPVKPPPYANTQPHPQPRELGDTQTAGLLAQRPFTISVCPSRRWRSVVADTSRQWPRQTRTRALHGGSGPILCWNRRYRFNVSRRWGWNPNGAGRTGGCRSTRARRAQGAVSVSRRARTASTSAMHRASRTESRQMTSLWTGWTRRIRRRTQRIAPGTPTASVRSALAAALWAGGLLGGRDRCERIGGAGQPCGQAVRQQADSGVTLGAVPASDAYPEQGFARVGAVACQRTSTVRSIRTPLKAEIED